MKKIVSTIKGIGMAVPAATLPGDPRGDPHRDRRGDHRRCC